MVLFNLFLFKFRPSVHFILGPMKIFTYYLDIMKDSVLALQLFYLLGSEIQSVQIDTINNVTFMSAVSHSKLQLWYRNFQRYFSSQVLIMLISSIIMPFIFGGFRLAIYYPDAIFGSVAIRNTINRIFYSILSLLLLPLHSLLHQLSVY